MASIGFSSRLTWQGGRLCRHVGVAVVSAALFAFGPDAEAQFADGRRMALVIGNSTYAHTTALRNPVNDAVAVGEALRGLGFDVTVKTDLGRAALYDEVGGFGERSASAEMAILFYAGHGIEVNGTSYLVPVDARLTRDTDTHQAMSLDDVRDRMRGTGLRLVILDACRDNPLAQRMRLTDPARSMSRSGLGRLRDERGERGGMLVWFATAAGETAPDGNGRNSPFTQALLEHLDDSVEIGTVFVRTTRTVYEATGRRQQPYVYGTQLDEFYLNGSDPPPPPLPGGGGSRPDQNLLWETALDSSTARTYEDYLRWYPDGWYADEARARLAALRDVRRDGEEFRDCDECPKMVEIPAGTFRMGARASEGGRWDRREGPQHRVKLSWFALGVTEVTFDEWEACVRGGGCDGYRPDDEGWGRGARPVVNVSWDDAQAYVRWLSRKAGMSYRLPSEAEWEYAARGGTTTPFHTGTTISTDQANYDGRYVYGSGRRGTYRRRTTPVGTFAPNAFGLHDVHGNVREWTDDCWHESYRGAPADGSPWLGGTCSNNVLRGGSWGDSPRLLRSAARLRRTTENRNSRAGFRVAMTIH